MLIMFLMALCLSALAIYAVVRVTRTAMDRLGLDVQEVLLGLGLAEWPSEERPPRAWQVEEPADEAAVQPRRRSPHRRLVQSPTRRRSAARPTS